MAETVRLLAAVYLSLAVSLVPGNAVFCCSLPNIGSAKVLHGADPHSVSHAAEAFCSALGACMHHAPGGHVPFLSAANVGG